MPRLDATVVIASVAAATSAIAAIASVFTSKTALRMQRLSIGLEGRRVAAADIARWAKNAGAAVEAAHNPENWRVPEGVVFGPGTGINAGDIMPPSHGRIAPRIEAEIARFEPIRELARLSFGDDHEVSAAVSDVIKSIQRIADRGVIYAEEDGQTPREYVLEVFWPRVAHLHMRLKPRSTSMPPDRRRRGHDLGDGPTRQKRGTGPAGIPREPARQTASRSSPVRRAPAADDSRCAGQTARFTTRGAVPGASLPRSAGQRLTTRARGPAPIKIGSRVRLGDSILEVV